MKKERRISIPLLNDVFNFLLLSHKLTTLIIEYFLVGNLWLVPKPYSFLIARIIESYNLTVIKAA